MSEPRRSTRARAREDAAPAPETPRETPIKGAKSTLKRKRTSLAVKDSTPSTPNAEAGPQGPTQTLPLKIHDGQPLPTLAEPQSLSLPASEWQDIQQSGVLSASLERSRAVWVSGVNFRVFHKYFTQPKKPADRTDEDKARNLRQKELFKNFPELGRDPVIKDSAKESTEVQAQLVIEPHTFPIRLYAPREMLKQVQKKTWAPTPTPTPAPTPAPTPTPTPTYGAWPNHSQPQHGQPNQYTRYNNQGQPVYQQKQQQPRPPPPKPVQKAPPPAPGPASTPAPDPVIHMLAARAGTDPELKAVMKIVAAGQASKQQLEFFQTHINELTAILARQKEDAAKDPKALPPPSAPKALPPLPVPKALPQPSTPQPMAAPPAPRPVQPAHPQQPLQNAPKPYGPTPPQGPQLQQGPTPRPSHSPYPNSYSQPQLAYHPPRQMSSYNSPPQPTGYRPLVFSFEEGNKDMLYFPSYSFMEWLPNMSGAKFSFLITKMKPKPDAHVVAIPPSTPAPKIIAVSPSNATPIARFGNTDYSAPNANTPSVPFVSAAPFVPPLRIEDFDERNAIGDIDFYQPVTVLLLTDNNEIRNALPRAIRPADVVERYMDDVFDKCKRAEETYLAFRLPRDGDADVAEKRARSGDGTPVVATPTHDIGFGGGVGVRQVTALASSAEKKMGRPRKSLA